MKQYEPRPKTGRKIDATRYARLLEMDRAGKDYKEIMEELGLTRGQVAGYIFRSRPKNSDYNATHRRKYGPIPPTSDPELVCHQPKDALWEASEVDKEHPHRCRHEGCTATKQPSKPYCARHVTQLIEKRDKRHYINMDKWELS